VHAFLITIPYKHIWLKAFSILGSQYEPSVFFFEFYLPRRKNTVYKAGYSDTSNCHVIRWFWLLVESWDQEMRARLLQFVTGTSKVPFPEGFKGLRGSEGLRSFHIVRVSDSTRLPQAHTCFNELILPDYDTYEELHNNLTTAIFETGNQFQLR
jgi:hypothetical protein